MTIIKKLLAILSVFLLADQASAEDIKMQCDWDYSTKYFKYSDQIFKDKAYKRDDGQWVDYCDGIKAMLQERYNSVTQLGDEFTKDKSASCNFDVHDNRSEYNQPYWDSVITWLVDFELMIAKIGYAEKNPSTGDWSDFRWFNQFKCTSF